MVINNDAKFEEKSTCLFEIDTTICLILTRSIKCLRNEHLHGLLNKVHVQSKKEQESYFDGIEY